MFLHNVVYGLVLSAVVTSAFNPYYKAPPPKVAEVGGSEKVHEWKSLKDFKVPRDAQPFRPVVKGPVDVESLKPLKEVKIKKLPPRDIGLHPEIRSIQHANAVTKRFRKRDISGQSFDGAQAIRDVVASLEKRGLMKRQNKFDITRSTDPVTPDSMAIHQDGNDYAYFSEIAFGSKNKTFYLVLDTGSSDTWIPASNCTTRACVNHNTFGPNDSKTLELQGRSFDIKYGTGEVGGFVVKDDISFAGFRLNVEFGLCDVISEDFIEFAIDGIMGLGFPEASQQRAKTIMEALVDGKHIDRKVFSVALSRARDRLEDGVIHFGAVDDAYFEGDIVYSPSISDLGYWEIEVDDFAVDGKSLGFPTRRKAIIDTGTSLILAPESDAMTLHAGINDAKSNGELFAIPCDTNSTLDITINDVVYSILPQDWVGEQTGSGRYCLSNVIGRAIFDSTWLIGDVFLKNVYSTYDFEAKRIGFAKRTSPRGGGVPEPEPTSVAPSSSSPSTTNELPTLTRPSSTLTTESTGDNSTGGDRTVTITIGSTTSNGGGSTTVGPYTIPLALLMGTLVVGLSII